ncbi:hypothetical protein HII31_09956 [Pseudocercospora fuligena]|uniref:Uncharacterized protein n=1 Tax=Pseudocercospora fuligena TaxID=685502 RepID=A0A8H6RD12_9PEZI|nr:hypothetical protein HII31_09956 [Pseudocercospora fuligena]
MWLRAGYQIQLPEAALCGGIAFNPLLVKKICSLQLAVAKERYQDIYRGPIDLYPDLMFTPGVASCNGMFFTQPPLQVMTTTVYAADRHPGEDESFTGAEKLSDLATEWKNVLAKKGRFKWPIRGWATGLKGQWHRTS